jgi:hypothetical protein
LECRLLLEWERALVLALPLILLHALLLNLLLK